MKGTTMTSTSKAGLTVTTTISAIDRTNVDQANAEDRVHVPLDWRMVCDRFDAPEPLRLLDDEDRIGGARAIVHALLMEGAVFAAVVAVLWIWRMCI